MIPINSNIPSLRAQNASNNSLLGMNTSLERLSSGMKVNSAKDNPSGSGIIIGMMSQINGLDQSVRNSNDAISMAQTAEGAMQTTTDVLTRMRELAVQSGNGTYNAEDKLAIQEEMDQLLAQLDDISDNTFFNGVPLLKGDNTVLFQVGPNAGDSLSVNFADLGAAALGVEELNITAGDEVNSAISLVDQALQKVSNSRTSMGSLQNRLELTVSNLSNQSMNQEAAKSGLLDTDYASETANYAKNSILNQASMAGLVQANMASRTAINLLNV